MALTVKDIEYASGAAGFAAMRADFDSAYAWDEMTLNEAGTIETFVKYIDSTKNGYIKIELAQNDSGQPVGSVTFFTGATTYSGLSFSPSGNYQMQYAHWAIGENFFALMGCKVQIPSTTSYTSFAGIFPCTNPETGKQSICMILQEGSGPFRVLSETMMSTNANGFVSSLSMGSQLTVVAPVCSNHCKEVANNIWFLLATPEAYVYNAGYRDFNGDKRYLLGRFLLPAN